MEWSWPIFFASLPIAIAFNMFGPFARNARRVDIYEKKTGNTINLILAGLGMVTGGVILAALSTVIIRFFDIEYVFLAIADMAM